MTLQVNVHEAKTQLSQLIARVEAGEEVVIARRGRPVVRLAPVEAPGRREVGFLPYTLPDSFWDPLPEEELARWEGRG